MQTAWLRELGRSKTKEGDGKYEQMGKVKKKLWKVVRRCFSSKDRTWGTYHCKLGQRRWPPNHDVRKDIWTVQLDLTHWHPIPNSLACMYNTYASDRHFSTRIHRTNGASTASTTGRLDESWTAINKSVPTLDHNQLTERRQQEASDWRKKKEERGKKKIVGCLKDTGFHSRTTARYR